MLGQGEICIYGTGLHSLPDEKKCYRWYYKVCFLSSLFDDGQDGGRWCLCSRGSFSTVPCTPIMHEDRFVVPCLLKRFPFDFLSAARGTKLHLPDSMIIQTLPTGLTNGGQKECFMDTKTKEDAACIQLLGSCWQLWYSQKDKPSFLFLEWKWDEALGWCFTECSILCREKPEKQEGLAWDIRSFETQKQVLWLLFPF